LEITQRFIESNIFENLSLPIITINNTRSVDGLSIESRLNKIQRQETAICFTGVNSQSLHDAFAQFYFSSEYWVDYLNSYPQNSTFYVPTKSAAEIRQAFLESELFQNLGLQLTQTTKNILTVEGLSLRTYKNGDDRTTVIYFEGINSQSLSDAFAKFYHPSRYYKEYLGASNHFLQNASSSNTPQLLHSGTTVSSSKILNNSQSRPAPYIPPSSSIPLTSSNLSASSAPYNGNSGNLHNWKSSKSSKTSSSHLTTPYSFHQPTNKKTVHQSSSSLSTLDSKTMDEQISAYLMNKE
jgi:hypothetical protein